MAVLQRVLATKPSLSDSGALFLYYYICDTLADQPQTGLGVGDISITLDSTPPKFWLAVSATEWGQIGATPSGGYIPTSVLGSGTPTGTKFLKDNNTWAVPAGGGGGATLTETEVDFGYPPMKVKSFTITDASVTDSSKIMVSQSGGVPTGKGTGESELDSASFSAIAGTGQFTLIVTALDGKIGGTVKAFYLLGA